MRYDSIKIGGVEAVLKDEGGLLRVLERDGDIGEVKGDYVNSNLKFSMSEGMEEIWRKKNINEIVISVGFGEIFRGLCKLVRMDLRGDGVYGFREGDYEVRILGNNAVWFKGLEGISLRDLDWGELVYNVGSVVDGTLVNHLNSKWGFGLGKWGKWKNDNEGNTFMVDLDEFTFVGFLKFILENGFKKLGYVLESSFLSNEYVSVGLPFAMRVYDEEWLKERYDLEAVINVVKKTTFISGQVELGNADGYNKNSSASVYSVILNNPLKANGERLFRDLGRPSYYQQTPLIPPNSPNRFSYECVKSGSYEVYIINENYTNLSVYNLLDIEVFRNCPTNGIPQGGTSLGLCVLNSSVEVQLVQGDIIDVVFTLNLPPTAQNLQLKDIKWGIRWLRERGFSRQWLIGGLMPKWSISDILLGCIHGFNLKFETDEVFKRVVMEVSDEWKDNDSLNEGYFKKVNEGYNIDIREKIFSKRLKNRIDISNKGELEKLEVGGEIRMKWGLDAVLSGIDDKYKSVPFEGRFMYKDGDGKIEEDDNPFFMGTYQLYEKRIKGSNSEFTPIVPYLGNKNYYDSDVEVESDFEDVPRLLVFGGQRVYTSGFIDGGTVRANGNNNYPLSSMWVVNYNDEDNSDLSLSYGDEYNVKGVKIWGLVRRFYMKEFLRREKGNKYKFSVEWGLGKVSFRELYEYDGKVFLLKKIEGYDGRKKKFSRSFFDEDSNILVEDLGKVKDVVIRGIGDVL